MTTLATVPGVVLRVRRVEGAPVVAVRVWIRGGARTETLPGQAYVTGRLLPDGTRRRDWRTIAEDAERLGTALHAFGAGDVHGVAVDALAADAGQAIAWAAELALEPAFPTDRVRFAVRQTVGELESLGDEPDTVAGWAFLEHLYAPHPRGRPAQGDPASLGRLTRTLCRSFHETGIAQGMVVSVAGAVDEEAVAAAVAERFAAVPSAAAPPAVEPPRGLAEPRREIVLTVGDQAQVFAGHLTVRRADPDHLALQLLAVVLGAGPGLAGRMPTRLREREGLGYAVSVATTAGSGLDPGRLAVYVGTGVENVPRAERAIREELERLVQDGITDDELEEARSYYLGREPFRRETARQWAELLAESALYGVPSDDPARVEAEIRAVDRVRMRAVIERHVRPADLKVTVGVPKG